MTKKEKRRRNLLMEKVRNLKSCHFVPKDPKYGTDYNPTRFDICGTDPRKKKGQARTISLEDQGLL